MTPIKIRGKRGAAQAEKWGAGKRRKLGRDVSMALSDCRSSAASSVFRALNTPAPRKRKQVERQLSKIEQLPTEILQDIFYFSANVNLALASPSLQTQLSSQHVYLQHTSRVLQPVLDDDRSCFYRDDDVANVCHALGWSSNDERRAATRLLSCKFVTWDFFRRWLEEKWEATGKPWPVPRGSSEEYAELWVALGPSVVLLPPRKVLTGPWTHDQICFLRMFARGLRCEDLASIDSVSGEVAYEGLVQAVTEGSKEAVETLLSLGQAMSPDTELMRKAVIDSGCNEDIVRALVEAAGRRDPSRLDLLDPALWSWAEKARASGNEKGKWLMDYLKVENRAARNPRAGS